MIATCIAILAIVAQINAGCVPQTCLPEIPAFSPCSGSVSDGLVSGLGVSADALSSGAVAKTVVAQGKYPVALKNCGPNADNKVPVTTSHVTAPCQEKCVRIPCSIPQPKVISHCCTCYKTIVRPRVHQQIITVPSVQRYVQTIQKPVVENIQYEALPVNCAKSSSGVQLVQVSSGASVVPGVSSCAPVVPAVASCVPDSLPELPALDASCVSASAPCASVVPAVSSCAPVELPKFPAFDVSCVSAPAPVVPAVSSCAPVELPKFPAFDVSCVSAPAPVVPAVASCASVELPKFPAFECAPAPVVASCASVKTIQLPKVPVFEVSKCQPISFGCGQC